MDFYVGFVDYIVPLLCCCSAAMVRLPALMLLAYVVMWMGTLMSNHRIHAHEHPQYTAQLKFFTRPAKGVRQILIMKYYDENRTEHFSLKSQDYSCS